MNLPEHGANPQNVFQQLAMDKPNEIIDYSENTNPFGVPKSIKEQWPSLLEAIQVYPEPLGEPFLTAVANYHEVQSNMVFIGNGAAEILMILAERYRNKTAIVVHPTFSEYEATLRAKGAHIKRVIAKEKESFQLPIEEVLHEMEQAAVLYLCTPNNPTGILPQREVIERLIQHGKNVQCEIVLDEAFIDFIDESNSFIAHVEQQQHVIILRSMTKMYAIPGIRLGYVVAAPAIIQRLRKYTPHWNVNGVAIQMGVLCLEEEQYRKQAIEHSVTERKEMTTFLRNHHCHVIESQANFIVFKVPNDKERELYRYLLTKGMVVRHSHNFIGMDGEWLRIGLKTSIAMEKLREELAQWFITS